MKKIVKKSNKNIFALCLLFLLILFGWFYWFELRPAKIRHDCSWKKYHTDAVQARAAMTMDQIEKTGLLINCPTDTPTIAPINTNPNIIQPLGVPNFCKRHNQVIIDDLSKTIQAIPAKDWYDKASDQEYKFCLRNNGL